MHFVDTHTHFYLPEFQEDIDQVVQRALVAGVEHFYLPALSKKHLTAMLELQHRYQGKMHLMAGLHPCYVDDTIDDELSIVEKTLANQTIVAIGEIGLDFHRNRDNLNEQKKAFQRQLDLAVAHKLPVVIHCRNAMKETLAILETYERHNLTGIFHCFSGSLSDAQNIVGLNLKLGIGGIITFKNCFMDKFLAQISIEHIVLETDAPYLAPIPHRGKRNESSHLLIIAEKLAQIYGITIEKIAEKTTNNALSVLQLKTNKLNYLTKA